MRALFSSDDTFRVDHWTTRRWVIVLAFVSFVSILPGFFSIPPIDRDETRFSHATREMVASGDYVDIRFHDGNRYKKPIGIYWLQSASVSTVSALTGIEPLRVPIWAYRLVSMVGAIVSVLLTFWIARAFLPLKYAGVAALMMAVCVLLNVEARIAKTDAMLLAVILVAQGILAHAWAKKEAQLSTPKVILFWGMIGIGILIKGPIILLVTGVTVAMIMVFEWSLRFLRVLRPAIGVILALLIAVPWFVAIGIKSEGAFFVEAGLVDFLAKVAAVQESHGGPPGIYALVMAGTFWPASIFFILAVPVILRYRREPIMLFAAAWIIPTWLIFEGTPTKLPHYVLPLYPGLAILTAYALMKGVHVSKQWQIVVSGLLWVVPAGLTLAVLGLVAFLEGEFAFLSLATGVFATYIGYLAWQALRANRASEKPVVLASLTALITFLAVFQFGFPKLNTIWITDRMVASLEQHVPAAACPHPTVVSAGYGEPSLAFSGPLDLRFAVPEQAAQQLLANPCRRAFVASFYMDRFLAALGDQAGSLTRFDTITGFALNGGDALTIGLFGLENGQ